MLFKVVKFLKDTHIKEILRSKEEKRILTRLNYRN